MTNPYQTTTWTVKEYTQYFHTHRASFYRYTYQLVKDEKTAQDIVMIAFEHCWEIKDQFANHQAMQAYLYRICRSRSLNFLKHGSGFRNKKELIVEDLEALAQDLTSDDQVTRNMILKEHMEEVYRAMQHLTEQKRMIILLMFQNELTTEEVASQLGITTEHVRVAKSKALIQLRNLLQKKFTSIFASYLPILLGIGQYTLDL